MKTFITIILSAGFFIASAQHKLNVSGAITIAEIGTDTAQVVNKGLEAYLEIRGQEKDEEVLMKVETDGNGKYSFNLPYYPADLYTISVSSAGCPTKQFVISTYGINPKDSMGPFNPIIADIELYKVPGEKLKAELYNSPMNQFYFDEAEQRFTYDDEYLVLTTSAQQLFKESITDLKTKQAMAEQAKKDNNLIMILMISTGLFVLLSIILFILYGKAKRDRA